MKRPLFCCLTLLLASGIRLSAQLSVSMSPSVQSPPPVSMLTAAKAPSVDGILLQTARCLMRTCNKDPCAKVTALSGEILLIRSGAPKQLMLGEELYPADLLLSKRGRATLLLYRGESYDIYPDSVTSVSRYPTPPFDLVERTVYRIRAKIRFIQDQSNINRIHHPTAVIAVRG